MVVHDGRCVQSRAMKRNSPGKRTEPYNVLKSRPPPPSFSFGIQDGNGGDKEEEGEKEKEETQ